MQANRHGLLFFGGGKAGRSAYLVAKRGRFGYGEGKAGRFAYLQKLTLLLCPPTVANI